GSFGPFRSLIRKRYPHDDPLVVDFHCGPRPRESIASATRFDSKSRRYAGLPQGVREYFGLRARASRITRFETGHSKRRLQLEQLCPGISRLVDTPRERKRDRQRTVGRGKHPILPQRAAAELDRLVVLSRNGVRRARDGSKRVHERIERRQLDS